MKDEIMDYPRGDDVYVTNGLLKTEIDRLRAENADLAGMLKLYFHAHETGNSLPPYIVTQARAILAKTASHRPASDQEPQKSA